MNELAGVGPRREEALAALGLLTVYDALCYLPMRYEDRRRPTSIRELVPGEYAVVRGKIESLLVRKTMRRNVCVAMFDVSDGRDRVDVVIFGAFRSFVGLGERFDIILYGRPDIKDGSLVFQNPDYAVLTGSAAAIPKDFNRILPVYSTVKGLPRKWLANLIHLCVASPGLSLEDPIPDTLLAKRSLPSLVDAFRGVHAPENPGDITRSMRRLAYGEFFVSQVKIFEARAARERATAKPLTEGAGNVRRFVSSLPFILTESQLAVIDEIVSDISGVRPMHRLLQGDVGSGKTVVALAAAAMCAGAGLQTAILVPTTILSAQFFSEASRYLEPLGIRCAELTGGTGAKGREAVLAGLASGEIDVLVGTHAIIEEDVVFRSLGLAVIDEQHRFGVRQRDLIAGRNLGVHALMMSATPIPRTLCMAVYGDIETSMIRGRPSSRKPVITRVLSSNHIGGLYGFISRRAESGDGCFWVCPSIGDEDESASESSVISRAADIEKNIRGVKVERLYGSMTPEEKSEIMRRFSEGESRIIVSTTVIEVGIDIPDAGVMVVEGASSFGLSQLHQLRGRVGRGNRQGVCILLDSGANIKNSRKLAIMTESDDGYLIAEEDLRLRGAGDIAGTRQHGVIDLRFAGLPQDSDLLELAREDARTFFRQSTPSWTPNPPP
ncbi:MAG: ATP-dependent DNA helicase RecG [Synergistaceae bacterium]|nr:ATP-dependent DNA helicase RecG [Synergistaceae bacterium]